MVAVGEDHARLENPGSGPAAAGGSGRLRPEGRCRHGSPACRPAYDTSPESNARFLADYAARPDVKKLPDGLMYRVLQGRRRSPGAEEHDVVTVYYKGTLINGKVFDQTKPEEPIAVSGRRRDPRLDRSTEADENRRHLGIGDPVRPGLWQRWRGRQPFRPTRPWSSL